MLICQHCQESFKQKRTNKNHHQKFCSVSCHLASQEPKEIRLCLQCNKETTNPKFCSQSCSASYTNGSRSYKNINDKLLPCMSCYSLCLVDRRTSFFKCNVCKSQENLTKRRYIINTFKVAGKYSKIYFRTCKLTGTLFITTNPRKCINPSLKNTIDNYRRSCQFRFGITSYKEWFSYASILIKQHGWYSTPGSRKGIKNINGCSRDHMFSITEGFQQNISPEIIKHPANCEIKPHKENQSKNTKSSITIEDLYRRIDDFNKIYGEPPR